MNLSLHRSYTGLPASRNNGHALGGKGRREFKETKKQR